MGNGNIFKALLAGMFFLSGFCSLVYQIVWIRLAYTHFGVILPVLSVSISVFMLGLGLGSYFGGKYIDALSAKTKIKSAVFYGFSEILIGIGAILMPFLFALGQKLLLAAGQTNSVS
jgi:predicted membrane-bound spermidine synthase